MDKKGMVKIFSIVVLLGFLVLMFVMSNQDGKDSNLLSRKVTSDLEKIILKPENGKYLKLVKKGNTFKGYFSYDNKKWIPVDATAEVPLSGNYYIGLMASSHFDNVLCKVTFDQLNISGDIGAVQPDAWISKDIGLIEKTGGYTIKNGIFTVQGAGADISGGKAGYQYVYIPGKGDFEISVRVSDIQKTDNWAKVGIMVRETLESKSKYVGIITAPIGHVALQWKDSKGEQYKTYLEKKKDINKLVRKIVHFFEFFVMAFVVFWVLGVFIGKSRKKILIAALLCITLAFVDEYHQLFIKGRTALFSDVLIDSSGALLALLMIAIISLLRRKRVQNEHI